MNNKNPTGIHFHSQKTNLFIAFCAQLIFISRLVVHRHQLLLSIEVVDRIHCRVERQVVCVGALYDLIWISLQSDRPILAIPMSNIPERQSKRLGHVLKCDLHNCVQLNAGEHVEREQIPIWSVFSVLIFFHLFFALIFCPPSFV